MHRRRFLTAAGACIGTVGAGCLSPGPEGSDPDGSDSDAEPEPVVEDVLWPAPELPDRDPLDVDPMPPEADPTVSEPVENAGDAGTVHVTLTALTEEGSGTYTGTTSRLEVVSLEAGERRVVTFDDVAAGEYDAYRVDARPASITVVVRNDGEPGEVTVSVHSADGETTHEERALELADGETAEVTFEGTYVQFGAEDLDVRASPSD